ncbi:hypothetical protein JKP88DRAFT_325261 [Tribonema minus]|uniref:Zn(2)-C6 fungal-type domain-containing protein n=1 Tax=Tribonema minus TaxID=303371 RepID=A0A835YRF7_9STRA|nr:hypothetical protein JKP88DRAFT_325261 [Tribonema minus]
MSFPREPVAVGQSSTDVLPTFQPDLVMIGSSSMSQDRGSSSQSQSQSDSSDEEHQHTAGGPKVKRRRKRQVGTAGEGRGEWNLRTTCDGCTVSKVRCNGKKPCARCERRNEECVYSEKRRQKPAGAPRVPVVVTVPPIGAVGGESTKYADRRPSSEDGAPAVTVSAPYPSVHINGAAHGQIPAVAGTPSPQTVPSQQSAAAVVLSADEQRFLSAFLSTINSFMRVASAATLREAMLPAPLLDVTALAMGQTAPREREISRFHACKAVLLGSVALGAMYCGEAAAGARYMEEARAHLRDCFDAVIPETAACYLLLVLYHVHVLDSARMFRYMGFAQQSFAELSLQVQAANCEISAAIALLSALLHVSCDSAISLDPVADAASAFPRGKQRSASAGGPCGAGGGPCGLGAACSGGACCGKGGGGSTLDDYSTGSNSRVLTILARALVHIDNTSRGETDGQSEEAMLEALCEADQLVSRALARSQTGAPDAPPPPSDLAILAVKVMAGYFRLQTGGLSKADMLSQVAAPCLDAVRRTPMLLNFPMGWHLARCVRTMLMQHGDATELQHGDATELQHGDATELQAIMEPYEARLPFANKCCQSARVIYDRFFNFNWGRAPPPQQQQQRGSGSASPQQRISTVSDHGTTSSSASTNTSSGSSFMSGSSAGGPPWDSLASAPPPPMDFMFRQGSFDMMRLAVPTLTPISLQQQGGGFDAAQRGLDVGTGVPDMEALMGSEAYNSLDMLPQLV